MARQQRPPESPKSSGSSRSSHKSSKESKGQVSDATPLRGKVAHQHDHPDVEQLRRARQGYFARSALDRERSLDLTVDEEPKQAHVSRSASVDPALSEQTRSKSKNKNSTIRRHTDKGKDPLRQPSSSRKRDENESGSCRKHRHHQDSQKRDNNESGSGRKHRHHQHSTHRKRHSEVKGSRRSHTKKARDRKDGGNDYVYRTVKKPTAPDRKDDGNDSVNRTVKKPTAPNTEEKEDDGGRMGSVFSSSRSPERRDRRRPSPLREPHHSTRQARAAHAPERRTSERRTRHRSQSPPQRTKSKRSSRVSSDSREPRRRRNSHLSSSPQPTPRASKVERSYSDRTRHTSHDRPKLKRSTTTVESTRPSQEPEATVAPSSVAGKTTSSQARERRRSAGIFGNIFAPKPQAPKTQVPERKVECLTCLSDDIPVSKAAKLACGHRMCHACLRRIFTMSVTDPQHMPPRCCTQDYIPLKHVDRLFNDKFKVLWNKKYQEYTTKNRIYCPAKGCGEWIKPSNIHMDTSVGRKYGKCSRCRTKVCALCNGRWHSRRECPRDEETKRFVEIAKEEGWQRCFNCKAMVELKEGCNHMTCRCRAEFCMLCGNVWKTCDCPWFSYAAVADQLNGMNVPEPIRVLLHQRQQQQQQQQRQPGGGVDNRRRQVNNANQAGHQPRRPPHRNLNPALTYQQEMDRRRAQERTDEELARRLQQQTFDEDGDELDRGGNDAASAQGEAARIFVHNYHRHRIRQQEAAMNRHNLHMDQVNRRNQRGNPGRARNLARANHNDDLHAWTANAHLPHHPRPRNRRLNPYTDGANDDDEERVGNVGNDSNDNRRRTNDSNNNDDDDDDNGHADATANINPTINTTNDQTTTHHPRNLHNPTNPENQNNIIVNATINTIHAATAGTRTRARTTAPAPAPAPSRRRPSTASHGNPTSFARRAEMRRATAAALARSTVGDDDDHDNNNENNGINNHNNADGNENTNDNTRNDNHKGEDEGEADPEANSSNRTRDGRARTRNRTASMAGGASVAAGSRTARPQQQQQQRQQQQQQQQRYRHRQREVAGAAAIAGLGLDGASVADRVSGDAAGLGMGVGGAMGVGEGRVGRWLDGVVTAAA